MSAAENEKQSLNNRLDETKSKLDKAQGDLDKAKRLRSKCAIN